MKSIPCRLKKPVRGQGWLTRSVPGFLLSPNFKNADMGECATGPHTLRSLLCATVQDVSVWTSSYMRAKRKCSSYVRLCSTSSNDSCFVEVLELAFCVKCTKLWMYVCQLDVKFYRMCGQYTLDPGRSRYIFWKRQLLSSGRI